MLTNNEQKTIERLLCAFAEGLAMALEHSKRAS